MRHSGVVPGVHQLAETVVDYAELAPRVEQALKKVFPLDTIVVEPGYQGRVRAKVVSQKLNGMTEQQKQQYLWEILEAGLGDEARWVSFIIGYGTDEL
jgi:acid stress-induced BolA-like protein IbaG/YrbA